MLEYLPQYKSMFILYILLSGVYTFWLTMKSKTEGRLVTFLLAWFLMMGSYTMIVRLKLPGISFFEIQPDRFIFLLFSFILISTFLYAKRRSINKDVYRPIQSPFEKVLEYYIIFVIISKITHIKGEGVPDTVVEITEILTAYITYLMVKRYGDKGMIQVFGRVIITTAIISSLVAILQIVHDSYFLRIGDNRIAFGSLLRANGIFSREYNHSYFVILGMVWTMVGIHKDTIKFPLIGLFLIGVFCSFMRMSWIIAFLVFMLYILIVRKLRFSILLVSGISIATVIMFVLMVFSRQIFGSTLVEERLSDGIESRFGYYEMVLVNIPNKPIFGYGGRKNEVYYNWMLKITGQLVRATGERGSIHNGYLANMFFYGIPAFILFVWFIYLLIKYFSGLAKQNQFYSIPLFMCILYMIANLTNSFLLNKYLGLVLAIHIGLGVAAYRKRIF